MSAPSLGWSWSVSPPGWCAGSLFLTRSAATKLGQYVLFSPGVILGHFPTLKSAKRFVAYGRRRGWAAAILRKLRGVS